MGSWEEAVARLVAEPGQEELVRAAYLDRPVRTAALRYATSEEWKALRRYLPVPPGTAIDLGAGNGVASYALARAGWSVIALEPDPSATVGAGAIRDLAASEGLDIDVRDGLGESMPIPDGTVDLVLARQVLHHARDLGQLCREVARVLRPGGVFLSLRDHVVSSDQQLQAFLQAHPLHRYYGGEHAYSRREYLRAIRKAGLTITTVLGSFDSVINYAPHTPASLRAGLARRVPAGRLLAAALEAPVIFHAACRVMSMLDQRPGRLLSVVARRP